MRLKVVSENNVPPTEPAPFLTKDRVAHQCPRSVADKDRTLVATAGEISMAANTAAVARSML